MNPLERAIDNAGWQPLATACSVSHQAIRKWMEAERLPRTEFSGETDHAGAIERATDGKVTKEELLQWSRESWTRSAA